MGVEVIVVWLLGCTPLTISVAGHRERVGDVTPLLFYDDETETIAFRLEVEADPVGNAVDDETTYALNMSPVTWAELFSTEFTHGEGVTFSAGACGWTCWTLDVVEASVFFEPREPWIDGRVDAVVRGQPSGRVELQGRFTTEE